MRDTRLLDDLLLSRSDVDRAAHLRADDQWLEQARSRESSKVLLVSQGAAAVTRAAGAVRLILVGADDHDGELAFLGVDPDGVAYFSGRDDDRRLAQDLDAGVDWLTLREAGEGLDDREAGLLVTAVALDNWRRSTSRCGSCGESMRVMQAGWTLHCEAEGRDHFPRTDPAVIMLPIDRDDRALLGRHVDWPEGRLSTFAGFVEAGESAEAAVRRELREETGIVVGSGQADIVYLGSQPWPFPCSLMLGYHVWTDDTTLDLGVDEIAYARWFTRDELRAAMAADEVRLPPPISISRRLIERWLGSSADGYATWA